MQGKIRLRDVSGEGAEDRVCNDSPRFRAKAAAIADNRFRRCMDDTDSGREEDSWITRLRSDTAVGVESNSSVAKAESRNYQEPIPGASTRYMSKLRRSSAEWGSN